MPYDKAERVWKFNVIGRDGGISGLITGALLQPDFAKRLWAGRPKNRHFEILYQVNDEVGISYLLLFRFNRAGFTNEDYCQILSQDRAVAWLREEGHLIPDYLVEEADDFPLAEAQKEIWGLLEGQALTAKELAQKVRAAPVSVSSIIKRIQSLNKMGRLIKNKRGCGYYRPDAPPQENTENLQDS